ncbi:uncharacterized protein SCODWIG_00439 [Saccharomycodes ludwigii]|uniref:AMP-activated protein kinase glycogen-binding domain-containing protein n=1 Tax=Saccharomycodes ludwigii TaxID=36035 RepID=A0A376B1X2_9ASCO|nr:uncharacterized protein SCODWIG_00439 [Saccharomycodes ludwigii]
MNNIATNDTYTIVCKHALTGTICIAGSFNNWVIKKMTHNVKYNQWEYVLKNIKTLSSSNVNVTEPHKTSSKLKINFKFINEDTGEWFTDDNFPCENDEHGNTNNVLYINIHGASDSDNILNTPKSITHNVADNEENVNSKTPCSTPKFNINDTEYGKDVVGNDEDICSKTPCSTPKFDIKNSSESNENVDVSEDDGKTTNKSSRFNFEDKYPGSSDRNTGSKDSLAHKENQKSECLDPPFKALSSDTTTNNIKYDNTTSDKKLIDQNTTTNDLDQSVTNSPNETTPLTSTMGSIRNRYQSENTISDVISSNSNNECIANSNSHTTTNNNNDTNLSRTPSFWERLILFFKKLFACLFSSSRSNNTNTGSG